MLSAVVIALDGFDAGTDALSLFVAFGFVGLVSLLVGMLESFSLQRAGLIAAAAAVATEFAWRYLVRSHVPAPRCGRCGGGRALTLPPLITRLARSGRVLATMLWIRCAYVTADVQSLNSVCTATDVSTRRWVSQLPQRARRIAG